MEQSTSLETKVFESTLKWTVNNFMEYSESRIEEIESKSIEIKGTDAHWTLIVHPILCQVTDRHGDSSGQYLSLAMKIKDGSPSQSHFYKFDVKVDGQTTEPSWKIEYNQIFNGNEREWQAKHILDSPKLPFTLKDGSLTFLITVWMKNVKIIEILK